MRVFCAILTVASLAAGGAGAQPQTLVGGGAVTSEEQNIITREWSWLVGTVRTTFTAQGPSEQVNQLDPQTDPLACEDCMLASSIQFELDDDLQPVSSR